MSEPSPNASLQHRMLLWLEHRQAESISALARDLKASRPALSRSAHSLLVAGLVRKDGRRWALTHAGLRECARLRPKVADRSGASLRMLMRAAEQQKRIMDAIDPAWLKQVQAQMQAAVTLPALRDIVGTAAGANTLGVAAPSIKHIMDTHQELESVLARQAATAGSAGLADLVRQSTGSLTALESVMADQAAMRANIEQTIYRFESSHSAAQDVFAAVPRELFAQQAAFEQRMAEWAQGLSRAMGDRLLEAVMPSRRAMDALASIAMAGGAASLAAEMAGSAIGSFDAFGLSVLDKIDVTLTGKAIGAFETSALRAASSVLDSSLLPIRRMAGFGSVSADEAGVRVRPPTFYRAFERAVDERREELQDLSSDEIEVELQQTLPLQISDAASRLVRARYACNKRSLGAGRAPIFKATTETEYISFQLAQHVVEDEGDFREFTNWMYMYIYESSSNLDRVTDFVSPDGIAISIKLLRNYYFHDLEHGDDKEIQRKHLRVCEIFQELIGVAAPETATQWQQAQLAILRGAGVLVQTLNDKLASSS